MTFLNAFLFASGIGAITIPILIHLLMRRRKKPVMWGAMRFIIEAYRRTRRRLLIERWLLLALRCLLLAAIAFALGRPIIGALAGDRAGGRTIYLLLDDSLTSALKGPDASTSLAAHSEIARALLSDLGDGDRVGIVLLGGPARPLIMPPTPNTAAAGALLNALTPTDARADLAGALSLVASSITESRNVNNSLAPPDRTFVIVISDLLTGTIDTESALPKLPVGVRLSALDPRDLARKTTNVTIKDVRPLRSVLVAGGAGAGQPEQAQPVTVVLTRSGPGVDSASESRLSLRMTLEGKPPAPSALTTIKWTAGQREAVATVAVESPSTTGALAIGAAVLSATLDADALPSDDIARVPIEVRESLRIGLLGSIADSRAPTGPDSMRTSDWLRLALRPREDSTIDILELDPDSLDAGRLAGLDGLIIAAPERLTEGEWERVRTLAESGTGARAFGGGFVMVCPPGDVAVHTWTDAMIRTLSLPWQIGREARTYLPQDQARPRLAANPDAAFTQSDLLAALRGELDELTRPINVWRILPVSARDQNTRAMLTLSDGQPLLLAIDITPALRVNSGQSSPVTPESATPATQRQPDQAHGVFVMLTTALDLRWTDLPVKPLMVPLIQELVRQGVGRAQSSNATVAGARLVATGQTVRLAPWSGSTPADSSITINEYGLSAEPQRSAGIWTALDSSAARRGTIVVNPDPAAGRIDAHDKGALAALLTASAGAPTTWLARGPIDQPSADRTSLTVLLAAQTRGAPTGPWLLSIACALALIELFFARSFSHANTAFASAKS